MKDKAHEDQTKPSSSGNSHPGEFDFEQWARQVRPQLLASLQKRGLK